MFVPHIKVSTISPTVFDSTTGPVIYTGLRLRTLHCVADLSQRRGDGGRGAQKRIDQLLLRVFAGIVGKMDAEQQ